MTTGICCRYRDSRSQDSFKRLQLKAILKPDSRFTFYSYWRVGSPQRHGKKIKKIKKIKKLKEGPACYLNNTSKCCFVDGSRIPDVLNEL